MGKNCFKIMHFTSSIGLFGAEKVIVSLATSMNKSGIVSVVGAVRHAHNTHLEIIKEAISNKLPVVIFESTQKIDFSLVFKLARYLKKEGIDILHTHNYKSNMIGILSAKLAGIPIISTVHGYTKANPIINFYEKIDRFILKFFFDKVVAVDYSVSQRLGSRNVSIINNGIAVDEFTHNKDLNLRKLFHINKFDIVIGTVGRLSAEKNHILFIQAAKKLIDLYPNLEFIIVGDGPLKQRLRSMVSKLKLANKIIFTGIQTNLNGIYNSMDIFALTSTTEGQPITILEAFSTKIPVIASRVGGVPNLVKNEHTGLLFDSGDLDGFVNAVSYLIDNPQKKEFFRQNAYEFVRNNFTVEQMKNKYEYEYFEILAEKRRNKND